MTLIEVLLALALSAIVAGVVGTLIQTYLVNENIGKDRVEQAKLARLTLSMIADDIRAVVRPQNFDGSGLEQILGGESASSSSSSTSSGMSMSSMGSSSMDGSSLDGGTGISSSADGTSSLAGSDGITNLSELPPGIYGTQSSIEFDISRLPRPDEYFPMAADPTSGIVGDMPSDVKTISYFVQYDGTSGVQDPLGQSERYAPNRQVDLGGNAVGLVRRSVDRAITQYAYLNATSDSLLRTGEIIAPEVVGLEFQYFDGTMWQIQWDSSTMGLPTAIKVTIAVQRESYFQNNPYLVEGSLMNLTTESLREFGIDLYSVNVVIPGVQLLPKPSSSDSGTSALGF